MSPGEIRAFLHERIPLTQALGVEVVSAGLDGVRLRAPLVPNANPHGTAFAGSLSSIALLAGWVWVVLALRHYGEQASVVVRRCEVDYVAPVEGAFDGYCAPPASADWQKFRNTLAKRGRARLDLAPSVSTLDGVPKVRARCEYAVKRDASRDGSIA
jgi:thioesterase domain-containing protein